jgi:hypothetical protein
MAYKHVCGTEDELGDIQILGSVQATLRTAEFGNGRTFWIKDEGDLVEDASGVVCTSIYCEECEKFVVQLDADSLNGKPLDEVEDELAEGKYAPEIVWVEE